MKKTTLCLMALLGTQLALAQNKLEVPEDRSRTVDRFDLPDSEESKHQLALKAKSAVTTIWGEDFANGIPSTWTQNGTPAAALWEYRGPNTVPSNSIGTRGAFGNPNLVVSSPTTNNGFIIFDSDYYDNGTTTSSGTVPAPHIGRLLTDTIDLSANPFVELSFNGFMRNFFSSYYVVFSRDGGASFPDTLELYEDQLVNVRSDNPIAHSFNVSDYIGGEPEAMMQFVFAGNKPGNNNGTGGYFWMIDDIELSVLPENEIRFTPLANAPAIDILYDGNPAYANYGNMSFDQVVPISFDANAINYGSNTQSNLGLEVEIFDANGTSVQVLSSPVAASVNMSDTVDFNILTTTSWTAPSPGSYTIVYRLVSDSLDAQNTMATDTLNLGVGDDRHSYSLDWGVIDNFFGEVPGNEVVAVGARYSLENEDPDSSGFVFIESLDIFMSNLTDSTADIEIEIYDTAGFVFNSGFPASAQPLFTRSFTLNSDLTGSLSAFVLGDEDSIYDAASQTWTPSIRPLALPTGTYYFVVNFFGNQPNALFRFANNNTFSQPSDASIFQRPDGDWFGGILNSTEFEAPVLRLTVAEAPPFNIGLSEVAANNIDVYPNPTRGSGFIRFPGAGHYEVAVFNAQGKEVLHESAKLNDQQSMEIDFSEHGPGIYFVKMKGEELEETVKVVVQ